jgi:DNA-binding transcriptional LysR family regulator
LIVSKLSCFRRAAEILNYAQSSISSQIKVLEEEIGTPLFQRQGRCNALSMAGKNFLRYAQKIVEMEREAFAAESSAAEPRGLISLRIPQSLGTHFFPAIIEMFRTHHPKVDFDVGSCEYKMLPHELKSRITDLPTRDVAFSYTKGIFEYRTKIFQVHVVPKQTTQGASDKTFVGPGSIRCLMRSEKEHSCGSRRFYTEITECRAFF